MKIGIIGTGAVGASLAAGWSRTGHEIVFGVRDTTKAEAVAVAQEVGASLLPVAEAAAAADVILLAVPWDGAENAVSSLGELGDKVLIDATNPLVFADGSLSLVHPDGLSGGEHIARWANGGRVVKTLNQVGAEWMSAEKTMPSKPSMFVASDDEAAADIAVNLVTELGFEGLNAGALKQAMHLEHFAMVWINQAIFRGMGRDWAFGALRNA